MKGRNNERLCLGCNEYHEKSELLRIVLTKDGVKISETGKEQGRSCYLCKNPDCIQRCVSQRSLKRGFRNTDCREIYETLREMLTNA